MKDDPPLLGEYWLGDRGAGRPTDFDGVPRRCFVVEAIRYADDIEGASAMRRLLLLEVAPPLVMPDKTSADAIVVTERYATTDIRKLGLAGDKLGESWLPVYVYRIVDRSLIREGQIREGALELAYPWADFARRRDLLPPPQEQYFEDSFRRLQAFAAREGHTDVPEAFRDDDYHLGVWVANIKFEQANFGLREDWAKRLQSLPRWRWLSGNDFVLLERFARREGHTHPPLDYEEEGRPLGRWVEDVRDTYALGRLVKDWIERLEKIPHWEWR
jgi:hypothetical protein